MLTLPPCFCRWLKPLRSPGTEALRAAFAAALRAIPEGKRTFMLDPNAPDGAEESKAEPEADGASDNPLASLLGHYRWVPAGLTTACVASARMVPHVQLARATLPIQTGAHAAPPQ